MRSDAGLKRLFRRNHQRYWIAAGQKALPRCKVCWAAAGDKMEAREAARTDYRTPPGKRAFFVILIDPKLRAKMTLYVKQSLLHEMAHLATWDEEPAHGPRWNAEMLRLAALGAFGAHGPEPPLW